MFFFIRRKFVADENILPESLSERECKRSSGNKYSLPTSDTLTILSLRWRLKFVDERPRYIRRVVTRDAEASIRLTVFATGKTRLDRKIGDNEKEFRPKELTQALMTDSVYHRQSYALFGKFSWGVTGDERATVTRTGAVSLPWWNRISNCCMTRSSDVDDARRTGQYGEQ